MAASTPTLPRTMPSLSSPTMPASPPHYHHHHHQTPPLLSLPPELISTIITHLPFPPHHTLASLRLTHPVFPPLITPSRLRTAHTVLSTHLFHREIALIVSSTPSTSQLIHELWPCYICLHELPRNCFAFTQTKARRSLGHVFGMKRFCMACGVRKGIYGRGCVLRCFGGGERVVCVGCGVLRAVERGRGNERGECEGCVGRAKGGEEDGTGKDELASHGGADGTMMVRECQLLDGLKMRKGRCQRCWAIDHTEKPAEKYHGEQIFCGDCWEQAPRLDSSPLVPRVL